MTKVEEVGNDRLPKEIIELLNEYKDIVASDIPNGLPPVRSISHCMDLIPRASLPKKSPYTLTPIKNEELNRQVHELLQKGLIREILSPYVVPNVLAPKKSGEWRMCTDSRAINMITMKYRFPMPRMDEIMDCLSGEKYFTKIDLKSGYHQITIKQGNEWKISSNKKEGLYELLVMPFGLTNKPSTFMRLMNGSSKKILG